MTGSPLPGALRPCARREKRGVYARFHKRTKPQNAACKAASAALSGLPPRCAAPLCIAPAALRRFCGASQFLQNPCFLHVAAPFPVRFSGGATAVRTPQKVRAQGGSSIVSTNISILIIPRRTAQINGNIRFIYNGHTMKTARKRGGRSALFAVRPTGKSPVGCQKGKMTIKLSRHLKNRFTILH